MKQRIAVMVAVNGAFIMTIGAWSAETRGQNKLKWAFRIIGGIFLFIGMFRLLEEP